MMLRLVKRLFVIVVIVGIVIAGVLWYVRPEKPLNMQYDSFSLRAQLDEMLSARKLSFDINEQELNSLLKKELQRSFQEKLAGKRWKLQGIHFQLEQDSLVADVHVRLMDRFDAGMQIRYALQWEKPMLFATFESASVRGFTLSNEWLTLPDLAIDLTEELPPLIHVKDVRFHPHRMEILVGIR